MPKRTSKPDLNQIAAQIVEAATNPPQQPAHTPIQINWAATALGRLGGLKGGPARAKKLTPKKRSQIAKKAAQARWSSKDRS
jgi:hypothetical protein